MSSSREEGIVAPDSQRVLEKYRHRAATYDRAVARAEPIRRDAIARLQLQPGEIVLDVGCGTGLSFPLIEERIGPEGQLTGIDMSPEMLEKARKRVDSNGWRNVTLIQSAVEEAKISAQVDAVLFHFTHDIMRSERALENIFLHAKPGASVVAAGGKWAPWWALQVNVVFWYIARRYITTFEGYDRPWSHLSRVVPNLRVEPRALGGIPSGAYIAWGTASAG